MFELMDKLLSRWILFSVLEWSYEFSSMYSVPLTFFRSTNYNKWLQMVNGQLSIVSHQWIQYVQWKVAHIYLLTSSPIWYICLQFVQSERFITELFSKEIRTELIYIFDCGLRSRWPLSSSLRMWQLMFETLIIILVILISWEKSNFNHYYYYPVCNRSNESCIMISKTKFRSLYCAWWLWNVLEMIYFQILITSLSHSCQRDKQNLHKNKHKVLVLWRDWWHIRFINRS